MNQDQVFFSREGDGWFRRNKAVLLDRTEKMDWPSQFVGMLKKEEKENIHSIAELGCSNGWRLNNLREQFGPNCRFVGVDASGEAIQEGEKTYKQIEFHQGLLSKLPLSEQFDLVIVYFVLHWVDRETLCSSIAEIDRVVKDNGLLIIGDFLPDFPQKRHYHHCPNEKVYTYKIDYAKIFESFGTYKELSRINFNHDNPSLNIEPVDSGSRAFCSLLYKSHDRFYPEV